MFTSLCSGQGTNLKLVIAAVSERTPAARQVAKGNVSSVQELYLPKQYDLLISGHVAVNLGMPSPVLKGGGPTFPL